MFQEEALAPDRNRIEAVTQSFLEQSQGSGYGTMIMLTSVGVAVALGIAAYFFYRRQLDRVCNDPQALFNEICRAHGLTGGQKSVLMKLVKVRKLKNPNLVLIDSNLWVLDPAVDAELCTPKLRNRLIHVQRLLFNSEAA